MTINLRYFIFLALFLLMGSTINSLSFYQRPPARPEAFDQIKHVVIIILENGSPVEARKQPYLRSLMKKGAFLADYHGVTHPSQPNYIAMTAGSFFNIFWDENTNLDKSHIGDLLENAGKTWKVYAEGYPGNCFLGATHGLYARKHVPFLSYKNVQSNRARCANIVNSSQFFSDIVDDALPHYALYIPDLDNDGHNTGLAYADKWLKRTFEPIFNDPKTMSETLFILTFDEDDGFHFNQIYTVFLGAGIRAGSTSKEKYDHYDMLRTMEEIFSLGSLGRNDEKAKIIKDIWQPNGKCYLRQ